ARPDSPRIVTINDPTLLLDNAQRAIRGDLDGMVNEVLNDINPYIVNAFRAIRDAPEETAARADWPVIESRLPAVHKYLVTSDDAIAFRERMLNDPDYVDVKFAALWLWGAPLWIGPGWCTPDGARHHKRPRLHGARQGDDHRFGGGGVHADRPPKFLGFEPP